MTPEDISRAAFPRSELGTFEEPHSSVFCSDTDNFCYLAPKVTGDNQAKIFWFLSSMIVPWITPCRSSMAVIRSLISMT